MVNVDIRRFLAASPEQLNDDDKEELYKVIGQYKLDDDLEEDSLRNLFCITQEVLKLKGDQVHISLPNSTIH